MLAAFGFITTGICFAVFAYTFYKFVVLKAKLKLEAFSLAYLALAVAFVFWGVAAAFGNVDLLASSVIVGNGLIVLGSIAMLSLLPKQYRNMAVAMGTLAGALLLYLRDMYYLPEPYMRGGILIFNTQLPVAMLLSAIFLFVWLPINVYVARQVAHAIRQDSIASIYSWIYGAATLCSIVFLSARRVVTVVLSFLAIGVCFVLLIMSNLLVDKLKVQKVHHEKSK
jgi:hypothetical protein